MNNFNFSFLLLALDGWTSPNGYSIYNFIIISNNKEYLYCLHNLSNLSYTTETFTKEIDNILSIVGVKKFSTIVTDNASSIANARRHISEKYPHILNIRCITHFVNLITKDILGRDVNQSRSVRTNLSKLPGFEMIFLKNVINKVCS